MSEIFTNSGIVKLKAGSEPTALTSEQYTKLIELAQSQIMAETKIDFATSYASLDADTKVILEDACSSWAAIAAAANRQQDFFSRGAAIHNANINAFTYRESIKLLKDKKVTDFLGAGS